MRTHTSDRRLALSDTTKILLDAILLIRPPRQPSWERRTHRPTFLRYSVGSSRIILPASMFAGESRFGDEIIEITETRTAAAGGKRAGRFR